MTRPTPITATENPDGTFTVRLLGETGTRQHPDIATLWAALDEIDAPHRPTLLQIAAHSVAATVQLTRFAASLVRRRCFRQSVCA